MFFRRCKWAKHAAYSVLAGALSASTAQAQYGPILNGAGPVNRSMGGTAVAAPLDGIGAIYWNPATTTALPNSLDIGVELLFPHTRLGSSLPASAFGPGIPPIPLAGATDSDTGAFPLPSLALIYRPDEGGITYGLGVFAVAGFGVNYSASNVNPILTPQPPNGFGLGSLFSELQVLQIAPTASMQLTDHLSVGAGPTLSLSYLRLDPLLIASPNANGAYANGGSHSRMHWGGGFQVGAYYTTDNCWSLGASLKSPQWFEKFHFHTVDEAGRPRSATYEAELPLIASVGVGYTGIERLLLAADFRYIDFANADGFRQQGYDNTGAIRGLGFDSIFAMSVGAQYQLTDCTSVRVGYSYNQNPIDDSMSLFNVASPTIVEHTVYVGASYRLSEALSLSLAYLHAFENEIDGPLVTPFGAVPGSSIRNTTSADAIMFGASVQFGHCSAREQGR